MRRDPVRTTSSSAAAAACGLLLVLSLAATCSEDQPVGSAARPVRLLLFPSSTGPPPEAAREALASYLTRSSGLQVVTRVPVDTLDAVQQLGSGAADVALLNSLGYLLAEDAFRARARLRVTRHGHATHRAQLLVRADDAMASPTALHGKRLAYVDPYSLSGFVLAAHLLQQHGVVPGSTSFVGSHVEAVRQVLAGDADAAATYVDENAGPGLPPDLQEALRARHPDAAARLRTLAVSARVPNEPVAFAPRLEPEVARRLGAALLAASDDPGARASLQALGNVGGFAEAGAEDYAALRHMLGSLGKTIDDGVPGGWKLKLRTQDRLR